MELVNMKTTMPQLIDDTCAEAVPVDNHCVGMFRVYERDNALCELNGIHSAELGKNASLPPLPAEDHRLVIAEAGNVYA